MDVREFFENIIVKRPDDFSCEYEVTRMAMESYCKYPHYKEFTYILINNINGYKLQNNSATKILTADILTSIKSPINKLMEEGRYDRNSKGIDIVNDIFEDKVKIKGEFKPYVKLFAMVYYTIGNMLPVELNPMRLVDRDTWRNKLLVLLDYKKENNISWKESIVRDKDEKQKFIQDNCLNDMIDKNGYPKPFFGDMTDLKQVFFSKNWSDNEKKQWFLNNSKIILQRSHRIINCTNELFYREGGKRTTKSIEEIESLFKSVFRVVGMGNDVDSSLY